MRKITENMVRKAKNTLNMYDEKYLGISNVSNYGIESFEDKSVISANQFLETDFFRYGRKLKIS